MWCNDAAYPSAVPQHAGCQVILWVPSVLFVFGPFCLPAIRFAFRLSDSPSGHPIKSAGSSFRGRCKNTVFLFKKKATPITEPRGPDLRSILPDIRSTLLDIRFSRPDIRSTLLDIRFSHPDIRSILPETAPAVPATGTPRAKSPENAPAVPETGTSRAVWKGGSCVWKGGDAVSDGQCMCVQHGKARVDHGVEYSVGFRGNVLMFQSRQ